MKKSFFLVAAIAIFALAGVTVNAQKITAALGGIVRDPSHAAIPGAVVTITNNGTAEKITTQTDAAGLFQFPQLAAGSYNLTVDAPGFRRLTRQDIILEVDQNTSIDLSMTIGSASQSVVVSGAEPLLETQASAVGQVISNRSIVDLPLNQRNPYSLILLVPGVTGAVGQSFSGLEFNVNGGRAGTTDVLLDGVPSSPPTDAFNTLTIFPSVDATQEFKVMTANYSAQFGLSGNGIINVVYKSGTNKFHGDVYEFLRNSDMDANTFINDENHVSLPHSERSQFGFTLGGPVIIPKLYDGHNKLFFFTDYEGLRQGQATSLQAHVPTLAERTGDFSADATSTGAPINIYDPTTTAPASPYDRQQFSCNGVLNVICPNRFDPVGKAVMQYYPAPNNPGFYNYVASGSTPYTINQWDVKLDALISDRQHLAFRYSVRNPTNGTAVLFPAAIAIAQQATTNTEDGIEGELDYTFARNTRDLYEVRYGADHLYFRTTTRADGFDPTQLGFASYLAQSAQSLASGSLTFPGFEMGSGNLSLGDGGALSLGALGLLTQTWMADNVRVFSRHTLTYGAEVRAFANNTNQVGRATGDFDFSSGVTEGPAAQTAAPTLGDAYASLLIGLGSGGDTTHNFKIIDTVSQYIGAFVQDDWRVKDNLTLNLGLRYELFRPRTERHNRMTWWDPTVASPLSGVPGLVGGLEYPGVNGNPRTQSNQVDDNFSPRLGFAYHPLPNLVIQGGYGIFDSINASEAAATVDPTGYRTDSTYYGTQGNTGIFPDSYISNPYPGASFVSVTGNSLGLYTATGGGVASPTRRSLTPYIEDYNLGIQYQFPRNWMIDVHYVGSHGSQLLYNGEANQLPDSYLSQGSALLATVPNPFYGQVQEVGPESGQTIQKRYLLAPFPQFTGVQTVNDNGAISNYNSIQIKVEKKFSDKFTLLLSYTGSKMLDDGSVNNANVTPSVDQGETYQDASIPLAKDLYGLSNADVSRILVTSFVYSLPFGRGEYIGSNWNRIIDTLFGGYQVNGILSANTGTPLSFSASNVANIFNPGERPNWNGQNAKISGSVESRLGVSGGKKYFNTADFSQPAPFTFGNMSGTSGYLRNPGYRNLDFSLFKTFSTKGMSIELRGEAFNLFNTPEFGPPNTSVSSSSFGDITSQVNNPRQIQIAAKILF